MYVYIVNVYIYICIYMYIYIERERERESCSLLVNPNYTDESWEGQNTCLLIYIYIKL